MKKRRRPERSVLVIDDDMLFCDAVREFFSHDELEVLTANTGKDGLAACSARQVDVVLLDQNLPDMDGHSLCPAILKHNEQIKIIFMTAYPSFKGAVDAIKAGAHDYLSKPFELGELRLAVERSMRTLDLEFKDQVQDFKKGKDSESVALVGKRGLAEVRMMVNLAASEDAPVLITGETGTGKNVAAKYIHYRGTRKGGAYIFINCAALPDSLIEEELFGHEKGAFTGAVSAKKGLFEMAEGGTLLLDEIGAMPMHLQSKLLGVLEDGMVRRLGGETVRGVNVRVIASTNVDLERAVAKKEFRDDLYYRLSVIRVHMPPLRDRLEDIPELCTHFLGELAGRRELVISNEELGRLMAYEWPGNVRELRNILERACILQKDGILEPSRLLSRGMGTQPPKPAPDDKTFAVEYGSLPPLRELEKRYINYVLDGLSGNVTRAADALGVSRSTLKRKLKEYEDE